MKPISVLLAEQEDVVRHGIRRILEASPGVAVIAAVSDTASAVAAAKVGQPRVAVIAAGLPAEGGPAAADRIKEVSPETRVLLLAWEAEEELARRHASARGYDFLLKKCSDSELVETVKSLGAAAEVKAGISTKVDRLRSRDDPGAASASTIEEILTPREREVLILIAQGKTNREIGAALGISANTADSHRKHIMEKLGVHSKTELVRVALLRGLGS